MDQEVVHQLSVLADRRLASVQEAITELTNKRQNFLTEINRQIQNLLNEYQQGTEVLSKYRELLRETDAPTEGAVVDPLDTTVQVV